MKFWKFQNPQTDYLCICQRVSFRVHSLASSHGSLADHNPYVADSGRMSFFGRRAPANPKTNDSLVKYYHFNSLVQFLLQLQEVLPIFASS
jgi:hypothetical protein